MIILSLEASLMDRRWFVLLAGAMLVALTGAFGQEQEVAPMAKDAHPSFEVATIKPSDPVDQSSGFHTSGHRLFYENEPMEQLIAFAYGVHAKQIVGAPEWFSKDRYDIKGVPDVEGQPNQEQQQEMLRKLLAERFGLKFHREKRELSIFAVTVAKGGPKMKANTSDPNGLPDQTGSNNGAEQMWRFTNNSTADFASMMQYFLDRPVIDQTELKGRYDFMLQWTTDATLNNDPKAPPGLFTAVQEQIGLKITPTKGAAEVLVIDHAERPDAN
jgi:uncharacterized protein (TIGR03435 family)